MITTNSDIDPSLGYWLIEEVNCHNPYMESCNHQEHYKYRFKDPKNRMKGNKLQY